MALVKIYSDGSAKGNPNGPGGYGTIVKYFNKDGELERTEEFTKGCDTTTNNRMELLGIITGLFSVESASNVEVYSDSKYVVNAFNEKWIDNWLKNGWKTSTKKPVKNIDLWTLLLKVKEPHNVSFIWIKGHDGHPENERCDYLATSSAEGKKFVKDENGIYQEVTDEN